MIRYQCRWRGSRNNTRRWRVPRTTTARPPARSPATHTMWLPDWATDWLKWLSGLQCGVLKSECGGIRGPLFCVGDVGDSAEASSGPLLTGHCASLRLRVQVLVVVAAAAAAVNKRIFCQLRSLASRRVMGWMRDECGSLFVSSHQLHTRVLAGSSMHSWHPIVSCSFGQRFVMSMDYSRSAHNRSLERFCVRFREVQRRCNFFSCRKIYRNQEDYNFLVILFLELKFLWIFEAKCWSKHITNVWSMS
jgi:hypothetical protein